MSTSPKDTEQRLERAQQYVDVVRADIKAIQEENDRLKAQNLLLSRGLLGHVCPTCMELKA